MPTGSSLMLISKAITILSKRKEKEKKTKDSRNGTRRVGNYQCHLDVILDFESFLINEN